MAEPEYGRLLREARERSGKTIEEMASLLGISWESYNDLETYDDEIILVISLEQLVTLSHALRFVTPAHPVAKGLIWRRLYLTYLLHYMRSLPLPGLNSKANSNSGIAA